jgi:EasF-like predicted methyltransferase
MQDDCLYIHHAPARRASFGPFVVLSAPVRASLTATGALESPCVHAPELDANWETEGYKYVKCYGLHGTYDHALKWLKSPEIVDRPKTILWLGSSLGNFKRHEVAPFLKGFRDAIRPGDTMLIGIDSCKDSERVFHAYNDKEGVTRAFTLNGLQHANSIMGKTVFDLEQWDAVGSYSETAGGHQAFVSPRCDVEIDGVQILKGERIRIEESYKYSIEEIEHLWVEAGLVGNTVFSNSKGNYGTV